MNLKDALVGFLTWIWIMAFGGFVIVADSLPMWVLLIIAALAWIAFVIVAIRDHQRDIKFPLLRYREAPVAPKTQPVYDQEEDKV